jgi:hypothetical protein
MLPASRFISGNTRQTITANAAMVAKTTITAASRRGDRDGRRRRRRGPAGIE